MKNAGSLFFSAKACADVDDLVNTALGHVNNLDDLRKDVNLKNGKEYKLLVNTYYLSKLIKAREKEVEEDEKKKKAETKRTAEQKAAKAKETQVKAILDSGKNCKQKFEALVQLGYYTNVANVDDKILAKVCGLQTLEEEDYMITKSPGDGDCMYHAIVSAARCAGNVLKDDDGNIIENGSVLRSYLLGKFDIIWAQLGEPFISMTTFKEEIKTRVALGLNKKGDGNSYAGDIEMKMIAKQFKLTISVIKKDTTNELQVINGEQVEAGNLVLLYTNNDHYDWMQPRLEKTLRTAFNDLKTQQQVDDLYEKKLKELKAKKETCDWTPEQLTELENALATVKNEKMQKITEAAEKANNDFKADVQAKVEEIGNAIKTKETLEQLKLYDTVIDDYIIELQTKLENTYFQVEEKNKFLEDIQKEINEFYNAREKELKCELKLTEETEQVQTLETQMATTKQGLEDMFNNKIAELNKDIENCKNPGFQTLKKGLTDKYKQRLKEIEAEQEAKQLTEEGAEEEAEEEAEEGAEEGAEEEVDKTVKYIIDTFSGGNKSLYRQTPKKENIKIALEQLIEHGDAFEEIDDTVRKNPKSQGYDALKKQAAMRVKSAANDKKEKSGGLDAADIGLFLYGFEGSFYWFGAATGEYKYPRGTKKKPKRPKLNEMKKILKKLIYPDQEDATTTSIKNATPGTDGSKASTPEKIDDDDAIALNNNNNNNANKVNKPVTAETKSGEEQRRKKNVDFEALDKKEALEFLKKYIDDEGLELSTPTNKVNRFNWFDQSEDEEEHYKATLYYKMMDGKVVQLVIACVEGPPDEDIIGEGNIDEGTTMELIEIQNYDRTTAGSIRPFVARVLRQDKFQDVKTVFLSPSTKKQIGTKYSTLKEMYEKSWKMTDAGVNKQGYWMKADKEELIKTLEKTNEKKKEDENESKTGDTIEQSAQESKDDQATKVDANTKSGTNVLFKGKMYNLRRLNIKKDSWILNKGNTETQALNGKAKKFDELTLANNKTAKKKNQNNTNDVVEEDAKINDNLDKDRDKFEKGEMDFQELQKYAIKLQLKANGKSRKGKNTKHFARKIAQHFKIKVPEKYNKKLFDLHSIWDDQEDLMVPPPSSFGLAARKAREFMVFE